MKMDLGSKIGQNLKSTMEIVKEVETNIGTHRMIPLSQINYNPKNRRKYTDEQVEELADSIREFGLQQNIVLLQESETSFKLIAGEKRTRAHRYLTDLGETGFNNIYAKVYKNLGEVQEELIMLQTNQLATLDTPEERAAVAGRINELVETLIENGQKVGSKRDMMKELSGKSGRQVERDLKLNKIIPEIMDLAKEYNLAESGIISFASMSREGQLSMCQVMKTMLENGSKPNRDKLNEMANEYKNQLQRSQNENEKMRQENQSLLKDKESLEGKIQNMNKIMDGIVKEKAILSSQLNKKDSDIENLSSNLENETKKNNPDKIELERLQNELKNAQNDRDNLNKELTIKDNELIEKERSLNEITARANDTENTLPKTKENIELSIMIHNIEKSFDAIMMKMERMKNDESIGITERNNEKLLKMVEKIYSAIQ